MGMRTLPHLREQNMERANLFVVAVYLVFIHMIRTPYERVNQPSFLDGLGNR